MTTQPAVDTTKTEAFLGKAIGDAGGDRRIARPAHLEAAKLAM